MQKHRRIRPLCTLSTSSGTKFAPAVQRWAHKKWRRKSFGKRAMRVIWHEITQWAARNFDSHPESSLLFWFASAKPVCWQRAGSETPRCSLKRLVLLLSIMKQLKLLSLCAAHTRRRRRRRDQTNTPKNTYTHSAVVVAAEESRRLRYLGRSGYDAGQCGALLAGGPLARDSLEAGPVWQTVVLLARAAACGQRKLRISNVSHARKTKSRNLRTPRYDKNS